MRERIVLLSIICSLLILLYFFQNHMNTPCAFMTILIFMAVYTAYMQIAFKHKQRKQRKHPIEKNYNYTPYISIMIPAHNEADVICETIENITAIDYPHYEIIVIDDRSTDNTYDVLEKISPKYPNLKYFSRTKEAFPGKSAVLNDALKIAKGEAILVFDADAKIKPEFLKTMLPMLEPADVGAVQAQKVIINAKQNFLTQCQFNEYILDTHFQLGRDAVRGAVELRGNGELVKRQALNSINGWNEETIVDDLDMSTRLHIKGWDVRYCPEVIVYEEAIIYFIPLMRQRRRWLEGTIRRYLEYSGQALTSKDISLRARVDMIAYISEFIMPLWCIMEFLIRGFKVLAKDASPHMLYSSIFISCIIGFGFFTAIRYALRRYDGYGRWRAFKEAVITSIYLLVIWFPLVLFIMFKILFMKKDMKWGKTTHGLIREEEENIKREHEKHEHSVKN